MKLFEKKHGICSKFSDMNLFYFPKTIMHVHMDVHHTCAICDEISNHVSYTCRFHGFTMCVLLLGDKGRRKALATIPVTVGSVATN